MLEELKQDLSDTQGRIAYLERREADLVREEASLPKYKDDWKQAKLGLARVREALTEARETLKWLQESIAEGEQLFADMSLEELEYCEVMSRQYEAEERRKKFRVIQGGKVS